MTQPVSSDASPAFCAVHRPTRRDLVRLGSLSGLALTLPQLLRWRATAAAESSAAPESPTFGRAQRVIMMFLHGGHPQQETFDPKPHGPAAVRGEFGSIATSLAGVHFCELLPQMATLMDRLAVVRSVSHDNPNHVQACLPAQTGHKHPPAAESRGDFPPSESDFPPFGAVLDALRSGDGSLPNWVRIGPLMRRNNGTVLHGQLPGFLGSRHSSFVIDQPLLSEDVQIQAISSEEDLTTIRLHRRRDLLQEFDRQRRLLAESAAGRELDTFYQRGFAIVASEKTRQAFDLASEPPEVRERYGRTEFGQRCLLARRLAEAGVPMVNISYCHTPAGSWDTHSDNFRKMRNPLAPTLDAAFTALMGDLAERGMLDDTLVVLNAEFGRTPQINRNAGRDHWPWVYSLVFAGGGIRGGTVYGASDASAAYATENPRDPADVAATIYHLLGVPSDTVLHDRLGRPQQLILGHPIDEILS
jgi:uncharacterized protein (DUF1501 family)